MNELNIPGLPKIQLTCFEYDETKGELTIDIAPDETLNAYVGKALGQENPATHEEMEAFFVNIIVKALEKKDGYDLQKAEKDQEENTPSV